MSTDTPAIVWFRQDLRIADNPALGAAAESGAPILPVYVLDDDNAGPWAMGAASRWWLHHSLVALGRALNGRLRCFDGPADEIIPRVARDLGARHVHVNRCHEPWRVDRDARIDRALRRLGIGFHAYDGSTLFRPESVAKADGTPYRVFTPYFRNGCLANADAPREPLPAPAELNLHGRPNETTVASLELMPRVRWYDEIAANWQPGEHGALKRLDRFLDSGLKGYKDGRNRPDLDHVSRLSPHLHFGEISPNQAWYAAQARGGDPQLAGDVECFLTELGWREFSYYLLRHWPSLPTGNLQSKFDRFGWRDDDESLLRWQRGQTGFPIVDAGMRELRATGYMHNRVRMIVGSFLVKNLLLHWRHGERWFWGTLVDADLANNSASWQWVAGSGADAAPYFRIFNPVTQGQKFDPDGAYVRKFVPELAGLAGCTVHEPWRAPAEARRGYPEPIVDLQASRQRALGAFKEMSGNA